MDGLSVARTLCGLNAPCVHPQILTGMGGADQEGGRMSNARDGFDVIGVVVDWIDACKQRRLDDLLDLYDAMATVECCEGGSFRGRSEMESYWAPRLARSRRVLSRSTP